MYEIDECISYVACVIVINWQIKKVKLDFKIFIKFFKKELLSILIWDVPNHQSSAPI